MHTYARTHTRILLHAHQYMGIVRMKTMQLRSGSKHKWASYRCILNAFIHCMYYSPLWILFCFFLVIRIRSLIRSIYGHGILYTIYYTISFSWRLYISIHNKSNILRATEKFQSSRHFKLYFQLVLYFRPTGLFYKGDKRVKDPAIDNRFGWTEKDEWRQKSRRGERTSND